MKGVAVGAAQANVAERWKYWYSAVFRFFGASVLRGFRKNGSLTLFSTPLRFLVPVNWGHLAGKQTANFRMCFHIENILRFCSAMLVGRARFHLVGRTNRFGAVYSKSLLPLRRTALYVRTLPLQHILHSRFVSPKIEFTRNRSAYPSPVMYPRLWKSSEAESQFGCWLSLVQQLACRSVFTCNGPSDETLLYVFILHSSKNHTSFVVAWQSLPCSHSLFELLTDTILTFAHKAPSFLTSLCRMNT